MVLEGSARQLRYVNQDQIRPQSPVVSTVEDAVVTDAGEGKKST